MLSLAWKCHLIIFYYGDSKGTVWLRKALEKVDNSLNVKGGKVVKYNCLEILFLILKTLAQV